MSCKAFDENDTFPINVVAETSNKRMKFVSVSSGLQLYTEIAAILEKAGWSPLGGQSFRCAAQAAEYPQFQNTEWFQPQAILQISYTTTSLSYIISHTNNAFPPTAPPLGMGVKKEYLLLADPYSLHVIYTGTDYRYQNDFSFCNLHINCPHREKLKVSCNIYATVNSAIFTRGAAADFGVSGFYARKSQVNGNDSWTGWGSGAVAFVGPRTSSGKTLSYKFPHQTFGSWLISPVIAGWADVPYGQILARGFVWNMVYFVGDLTPGDTIEYGANSYYVIAAQQGCSLAWRIT